MGLAVLVVEDDHVISELLREILEGAGLQPFCVRSDREAYAILPTLTQLGAMIADVNLGVGTTGFDVARFARQLNPELAVIYVTGEASGSSCRAFGVPGSDFLQKPFATERLLAMLRSRLLDREGCAHKP